MEYEHANNPIVVYLKKKEKEKRNIGRDINYQKWQSPDPQSATLLPLLHPHVILYKDTTRVDTIIVLLFFFFHVKVGCGLCKRRHTWSRVLPPTFADK